MSIAAREIASVAIGAGAFQLRSDSKDAAVLVTLPPGPYTAVLENRSASRGAALVEVYDVGEGSATRVINLSSRALSGGRGTELIAGFGIGGDTMMSVLIRAVGPGLAPFGVAAPHPDPVLRVFAGNATIDENDDWSTAPSSEVERKMIQVGAFPLAKPSRDAAMLLRLAPGMPR